MKGSYRRNLTKTHARKIIIATVVIAVGIMLLRSLFLGTVSFVNTTVYKVSFWLHESTNTVPDYFRDIEDLRREIVALQSQLASHDGDAVVIANLMAENKELRSLLGDVATRTNVVASVIGRPPQLPYDALLVDVGIVDGIERNAVVYVRQQQAIGMVVETYERSSLVKLITSSGVKSSVYVIGPDIYTNAVGVGGGVLQVNVPQGIVVRQGDLVVVPALGGGVYGAIDEVVTVPTEPVQYAYVSTEVPIQSIRVVSVSQDPVSMIEFAEAKAVVDKVKLDLLTFAVPEHLQLDVASSSPTTTVSE